LSVVVKVRPADVAASGDNAWYADVTGVVGDAVGAPRGDLPSWNVTPAPGAPGAPGTQATPQNAIGAPATPAAPLTPFNTSTPPVVPQQ